MKYFLPLLCFLILQCRQSDPISYQDSDYHSIRFQPPESLLVDDIFDTTQYVLLETKKECLIGAINKIYPMQDKVFVFDKHFAKAIYAFDIKTGKFLFQIGSKGKAPGQYHFIVDFTVNDQEVIMIEQGSLNPKRYSCMDGNFLGIENSIKLPENGASTFEVARGVYYFDSGNSGYFHNYSITSINKKTNNVTKLLKYNSRNKCNISADLSRIAKYDSTIFLTQLFNDTIYSVNGNIVSPFLILNFDQWGIKQKELLSMKQKDDNPSFYKYFANHLGSPNKLLVSKRKVFMEWGFYKRKNVSIFYDKETQRSHFTSSFTSEKGNFLGNILYMDDHHYYSILNTEDPDLLKVFNRVFDQHLSINSNPILAIHSIK